jgi:hypothetical protein
MPAPVRSDDPLPRDAIRLSDAFELYCRAVTPEVIGIETELAVATEDCEKHGGSEGRQERLNQAFDALDASRKIAEKSFRVAADRPTALIRDPKNHEILKLDHRSWDEKANFGIVGFHEDFVDPDDLMQPGPHTYLNGALRPVFFEEHDFHEWLRSLRPAKEVAVPGDLDDEVGAIAAPTIPQSKSRAGRKRIFDWDAMEQTLSQLLAERGDPNDPSADWRSTAELAKIIITKFENDRNIGHGNGPGLNTVYGWLKKTIPRLMTTRE